MNREQYRKHGNCEMVLTSGITSCKHTCTAMYSYRQGARCSSVVRAFAYGAMGRRINPLWGGPIELFLVPGSAPQLV